MKAVVEKVRTQAMGLSASERASLAHDLIISLDAPSNLDLDPDYEQELRKRVRMVREGKAKGRPMAAVFREIEAKYE